MDLTTHYTRSIDGVLQDEGAWYLDGPWLHLTQPNDKIDLEVGYFNRYVDNGIQIIDLTVSGTAIYDTQVPGSTANGDGTYSLSIPPYNIRIVVPKR